MNKAIKKGIINAKKVVNTMMLNDDVFAVHPIVLIGKGCLEEHAFEKWETTDDQDNGGTSYCSHTADTNLLMFKGKVIFDEQIAARTKIRSGYCGIRGVFEHAVDMSDYTGFEVNMKSSTPMTLTMNMRCQSFFNSDIFQFHFQVTDTWRKYHIPFRDFM